MPHRELIIDTFYHVYNRGCNKQKLFFEVRDYNRFYANIERYLPTHPNIEIFAHCILPNHFHFLLKESSPGLVSDEERSYQISSFLNRIQQAYAMYFNAKYGPQVKPGLKAPVFEGRFKAKAVDSEDYLGQLQVYIEHNAVKHELVDRAEDWPWTSYQSSPGSKARAWKADDNFNPVFA